MKIWVDDERRPPPETGKDTWLWAQSSSTAIYLLKMCRQAGIVVSAISLDHDLGGDDTTRRIVIWMCEREFWPLEVRVHTANPVGREWLEGMVERYKP